jgi:GntR family transcriptional repressor for pyruvate dehydrogenase complex
MFKQRTTRVTLLDQHRAINDALQERNPTAARKAVEAHLGFVEGALRKHKETEKYEEIAKLRLQQQAK